MGWIIFHTTNPELCWSNATGWQLDDYDTFTDEEKASLPLPLNGEWEAVPWDAR